jgi:hypothetical protein
MGVLAMASQTLPRVFGLLAMASRNGLTNVSKVMGFFITARGQNKKAQGEIGVFLGLGSQSGL